ncbi:MAG: hypothetical protein WBA40_02930 [Roseiarcus sp.]
MFKRTACIQFPDDTDKTVRVGAFPRWIGDQSRCVVWCPGNHFWPALAIRRKSPQAALVGGWKCTSGWSIPHRSYRSAAHAKNVIDAERVFTVGRLNAEILRQTAAKTDSEIAKRGCNGAADMLDEFEATVRNMVTKPPGAGTRSVAAASLSPRWQRETVMEGPRSQP